MLTHPACSPVNPRGWLMCPEAVLGALELRNKNILDAVKEILILVEKVDMDSFCYHLTFHTEGIGSVETMTPNGDAAIALRLY